MGGGASIAAESKQSYTNSFSCMSGTSYEISIAPEMWYGPGKLNIPSTGVFQTDTTISATAANTSGDRLFSFYKFIPAIATTGGSEGITGKYGVYYWWESAGAPPAYGALEPKYYIDSFGVNSAGTRVGVNFWGTTSVRGKFDLVDIYVITPDKERVDVMKNIPNSSFSGSGDLELYGNFQHLRDTFIKYLNQQFEFYIRAWNT